MSTLDLTPGKRYLAGYADAIAGDEPRCPMDLCYMDGHRDALADRDWDARMEHAPWEAR